MKRKEQTGPIIVGLGGSGHEWASCAAHGDKFVALAEERVTRLKYGLGADLLAAQSRKSCLDALGLKSDQVEHAIACDLVPRSFKFGVRDKVEVINHHLAHAYCAFAMSGYEDAAILIVDNAGSILSGDKVGATRTVETISIFDADRENGIRLVERIDGEQILDAATESDFYDAGATSNSLGHLYRTASLALGFSFQHPEGHGIFSEDGKTMGLAPYGDERFVDASADLIKLTKTGLTCDISNVEEFLRKSIKKNTFDERAAIAFAVQHHLELSILHLAEIARQKTGRKRICLAGGVALNSVANGKLVAESAFESVYVAAAPSDDGIALGCAAYGLWNYGGQWPARNENAYLGPEPDIEDIENTVKASEFQSEKPDDIVEAVAQRIANGLVVAWFQGRAEYGPRALGHRSILAPASPGHIRDKLNHEMKRREWFRPYAPMVPAELKDVYFDFDNDAPHMSFVAPVRRPNDLPAATHVDGTARLQTVAADENPEIHAILHRVGQLTGTPIVLNTSFNRAGDPIVETAEQAIESAVAMNIDFLAIGPYLLTL